MQQNATTGDIKGERYLSALGAWALAFGCAVGWGSFVMPGNTFLPIAGPVGSALGLVLGALVMLLIGANYAYLMRRYPDGGGTYTYTKECFGHDQGFLSAWFLLLTYIAVLWANASALPLIARTLFGSTFQFGFHYEIAGFHVYFGELLVCTGALLVGAYVCLRRTWAIRTQIVAAFLLLGGILVCFVGASGGGINVTSFEPAFAPDRSALGGTLTIFALAPWAYVGFESISHSAAEARFPLRQAFPIMCVALLCGAVAYALLVLLATTAAPAGNASWIEYIAHLGDYSGVESQPTFNAAFSHLGPAGSLALGLASLGGIATGLVGNYVALSRLIKKLADDGMISAWFSKTKAGVPRNAVMAVMFVSIPLPFFGRTAISWIVDVTTVGATIAYAFTSACAYKEAKAAGDRRHTILGVLGMVVSVFFALEFLVPNMTSVTTLSTESYLILAAWGILGFVVFILLMRKDEERRLGRSIIAWVILLGLVIFTSTVWMRQSAKAAADTAAATIEEYASGSIDESVLHLALDKVDRALGVTSGIQVFMIIFALLFLFLIYTHMQRREQQVEVERAIAEESSRAKTSFLSNMSHEIRTPMNAIIGLDNIALRDPDLSPRTREHLEKIGASAQHLLGLINDILDMSRIESGRMALKDEEFSFREFLDQVNIIINGQCQDKGLDYICSIKGHVSDYYYGDDMKLKQVLINILGNSVKFTEAPGTVTLTVEEIASYEGMCTMRLQMSDTGIGMDKDYLPKIFDSFSQEDETATNRYGGSGLGMAITKNFVEMMNGDIEVESEKGVGSTFTVTVTLRVSSRAASKEQGIVLPHDIRAIIIDDDAIACEHAQLVLRSLGIDADTSTSPRAAVEQIRAAYESGKPYGLILTDYKMAEMDGLKLVREVRSFDKGESAILLLTGYSYDGIEEEARASGVDDVVGKPLFSDSLMRRIHGVFMRKEGLEFVEDSGFEQAQDGMLVGKMVLMAEDVEQNAEILQDLLELEEMEVEHAQNGEVAVKMFEDSPEGYYDVILMDVRMPVMDGLSATRAIRALDRPDAKAIPIIAMTANVFDEDMERSLQAGMNAHLFKPVEPDRLYETMAKYLS